MFSKPSIKKLLDKNKTTIYPSQAYLYIPKWKKKYF